jgi:hypothetical protein
MNERSGQLTAAVLQADGEGSASPDFSCRGYIFKVQYFNFHFGIHALSRVVSLSYEEGELKLVWMTFLRVIRYVGGIPWGRIKRKATSSSNSRKQATLVFLIASRHLQQTKQAPLDKSVYIYEYLGR